jgi:hypothetical protein
MDRADLRDGDEAWIAKYREALKITPVEISGFVKFRIALGNACQFLVSRFRRSLHRGPQSVSARATNAALQPPASLPKKSAVDSGNKPAVKKRGETTGRLRPPRPVEKGRAQRRA